MSLIEKIRATPLNVKAAGVLTAITVPVALIAIPLIYFLLKAVLGILALLVAAAGSLAIWRLLPWINMKLANATLRLMKIEARKNPIETLENRKRQRADRLGLIQGKYANIKSAVGGYKSKLVLAKKDRPDDDYSEEEKMVARFDAIVARIKYKVDEMKVAYALYVERVESAKNKYALQLEAAKVKAAIGSFNGEKVLKDILEREAFDSVDTELDKIFTELEIMLDDENVLTVDSTPGPALIENKGEAVPFLLPASEKQKLGVKRN